MKRPACVSRDDFAYFIHELKRTAIHAFFADQNGLVSHRYLGLAMSRAIASGSVSLMLVDEIARRVKNEFSQAIKSLTLAASATPDPRCREILARTAQRLRAHADVHGALQAPDGAGDFELADYLSGICSCISAASLEAAGARLTLILCEASLSAERCWRLGLIITELIYSAFRHGLGGAEGEIIVEISRQGGALLCRVSEDGNLRLAADVGIGRRLIAALAADLGGIAEWHGKRDCSSVLVTIPLHPSGPSPLAA